MPSTNPDQSTRLLAMLGSILVIAGVYVPCVQVDSPFIYPQRLDSYSFNLASVLHLSHPGEQTLAAAEPYYAVGILFIAALVCAATFGKSSKKVAFTWIAALLLIAAIVAAAVLVNKSLATKVNVLKANRDISASYHMLWGWAVLGAGGLVQLGTAVWGTRQAKKAPPAETPAVS
jgi:hypothetical protein